MSVLMPDATLVAWFHGVAGSASDLCIIRSWVKPQGRHVQGLHA